MRSKLSKYNKKRDFSKTSEPEGRVKSSRSKLKYCVQHHIARKDHYDLRLELDGVLVSFAVPKGPSYNTKDKRLAVHVEDHPIDYRNFEGVIPKGSYGAGTVMLWDKGYWECLGDAKKDLKNGSLKFVIKGKRLQGAWALVRFKDNNWLLIKEKDGVKLFEDINYFNTSIKTGRTMDEITNNVKIKQVKKSEDIYVQGVKITNPNKVIFKNPKVTKLDLVRYYEKISKYMIPFLKNRLISVIRAPEGSNGDKFFKKHLDTDSKGIGKVRISNDKGNREDYYYIKDVKGLISEVQMNSFEFHIWGSNVKNLGHPDIMVFDLDPDEGVSLSKVREGARDLKSILDEMGMESYIKTSGGKGYHIIVSIKKKTWRGVKSTARKISNLMVELWPQKYTNNIRKKNRKGKIFIDYFRNNKGATSVAPYSVRLRKKATVSMPIAWEDLDKIRPDSFNIKNAFDGI